VVFGVSTGLIILHDMWRLVTGKISDDELVMVKESEEAEELEELQKELAAQDRLERDAALKRPS